jgi:hypothetical protein
MSKRFAAIVVCGLVVLFISPQSMSGKVVKIGSDRVSLAWGGQDYALCTTSTNPGFCGKNGTVQFLNKKGNATNAANDIVKVVCKDEAMKECKSRGKKDECRCAIFSRHNKETREKDKKGKNQNAKNDVDTYKHGDSYDKNSEYLCLCVKPQ